MYKYYVGGCTKRHKGPGIIGMGLSEFRTGGGQSAKPVSAKVVRAKNDRLGKSTLKTAKATLSFALRSKKAKRAKCKPTSAK